MSGETVRLSISLMLAVYFLLLIYIKDKYMQVCNCIFDLLWTFTGFFSKFCSCFSVPSDKRA
jgi:hypothetical protein